MRPRWHEGGGCLRYCFLSAPVARSPDRDRRKIGWWNLDRPAVNAPQQAAIFQLGQVAPYRLNRAAKVGGERRNPNLACLDQTSKYGVLPAIAEHSRHRFRFGPYTSMAGPNRKCSGETGLIWSSVCNGSELLSGHHAGVQSMPQMLTRRFVLASCVAAHWSDNAAAAAEQDPTITVASQLLPPTLEPMGVPGQTSVVYRTEYSIFDGLLGLDYRRNSAIRPMLATKYERLDDRTWEFKLRPGVTFHDGRVMTADDVAFSFGPERLTGPDAPGRSALVAFLPTLEGAEKVDDQTVRLTTRVPDPTFDKRLASWGGQVVSRASYLRAASFASWSQAPVGAGPYKVAEFRRDYSIGLVRHETYWGGRPPYGGVRFRAVPELASRVAGLLSGDFDIATDITPDTIGDVEGRPGFRVLDGGSNVTRMVVLDSKHNPQLADVNLRRALILGVDRDLLVRTLLMGRSTVPNGFQSPTFGALYDPARPPPAYDPDRAKALVQQSSYRGELIAFRTTGTYYVAERATTEALVAMWADIGVNVRIETVENYAQWYARPGSGMYNYSSAALYPDPLSSLVRNFGPNGQVQTTEDSWSNPEFNRLSAAFATSADTAERARLHSRMLDIIEWEDPAFVLLFMQPMLYGARAQLEWAPYPAHQMDFGPFNARG